MMRRHFWQVVIVIGLLALPVQAKALAYVNALCPRLGDWFVRRLHLQGWEENDRTE